MLITFANSLDPDQDGQNVGPDLDPNSLKGAQLLSGRVLNSRPKGRRFEPHRRHCVVVLEQDTFILA